MTPGLTMPRNTVLLGDCVAVMRRLPAHSVDFALVDPPYITRYRPRSGERVTNDDNGAWLRPAFAQLGRLLKPASFCVSFYGWARTDLFFAAWARGRIAPRRPYRLSQASRQRRSFPALRA